MKRTAAVLCVALIGAASAHAGGTASLPVRSLAASCAACHGTDGHAVRGSAIPPLAGMTRAEFQRKMQALREGTPTAPRLMEQIAVGFNDAQIEALAVYFEQQRVAP